MKRIADFVYYGLIPLLLFFIWLILHDIHTSKGGFWYYFWPVYVTGGIAWLFMIGVFRKLYL